MYAQSFGDVFSLAVLNARGELCIAQKTKKSLPSAKKAIVAAFQWPVFCFSFFSSKKTWEKTIGEKVGFANSFFSFAKKEKPGKKKNIFRQLFFFKRMKKKTPFANNFCFSILFLHCFCSSFYGCMKVKVHVCSTRSFSTLSDRGFPPPARRT